MTSRLEYDRVPRRRRLVNTLTRHLVGLGGAAVIGAIALIFVYLLWVVVPIFAPAEMAMQRSIAGAAASPLLIGTDDNSEFALAVSPNGDATFIDIETGITVARKPLLAGTAPPRLRAAQRVDPTNDLYALVTDDGAVRFVDISYHVRFDGDRRIVESDVSAEYAGAALVVPALESMDFYRDGTTLTWAGLTATGELIVEQYLDADSDYPLEDPHTVRLATERKYQHVVIGARADRLYLISNDGHIRVLDISVPSQARVLLDARVAAEHRKVLTVVPLLGRISLLVADDAGRLTQWFVVRNEFGYRMEAARRFEFGAPIAQIVPERRRKGFAGIDTAGNVHLAYSTSGETLARYQATIPVALAAFAPRANRLLLASTTGDLEVIRVENAHPEIAWNTLWERIWYEGYPEPVYSWQSSSADSSFEPKFSLMPLAFGTMKAAFYAMLFAMPLAVMGAIYTAYFMAPSMRRWVKPGIEIMAALPTVILGFLAGLWLAPLIETHLATVLSVILLLPPLMMVFAWLWYQAPRRFTEPFTGWYGALCVPLIGVIGYAITTLTPTIELWVFDGDALTWLRENWGLEYDQRNALVVGLAMGLAVIPTIFAISEDAIYGVPRHLINGSLALGANGWQTLVRVVLLTASPGIFSAVMIGFGRAVGETMIVLMATGNTPVMDLNIFEGMRTFAANIAVELPESEVDSSHYRILFLAALVLFMLTFVFNTAAELVRQRLRGRYGSL